MGDIFQTCILVVVVMVVMAILSVGIWDERAASSSSTQIAKGATKSISSWMQGSAGHSEAQNTCWHGSIEMTETSCYEKSFICDYEIYRVSIVSCFEYSKADIPKIFS